MGYFRRWRKTSVAELRKMVVAEKFFRAIAVAFFVFQKTPKIALFRVPACRQGGVNCWVSDYPLYIQYEVDPQKTSLLASKFPKFSQQNPNTDVFNFFSSPKIDFPDFLEQLAIFVEHNFIIFPRKPQHFAMLKSGNLHNACIAPKIINFMSINLSTMR